MNQSTQDTEMERKQILPPTYFLVSILFMGALRLFLPIRKVIVSPYNYFGILPILIGAVVNMWCSSFYNKVKTTVKPFEPSSYLVTEGLYRFSRHPMYVGMVLILVGLAVLLGTIGPVLVIPAFI